MPRNSNAIMIFMLAKGTLVSDTVQIRLRTRSKTGAGLRGLEGFHIDCTVPLDATNLCRKYTAISPTTSNSRLLSNSLIPSLHSGLQHGLLWRSNRRKDCLVCAILKNTIVDPLSLLIRRLGMRR